MANKAGLEALSGPRDLALAKKLVAESGYKGEPILLMSPTDQPALQQESQLTRSLFQELALNREYMAMGLGFTGDAAGEFVSTRYLCSRSPPMAKTRGAYPPEFRRQMVELVHAGRTPEELAHEFEPTAQSIRNWVAQWERNAGRGDGGLTTAEREEFSRLRRENRQLRLEREILSKAAAWFARETNAIPPKGSGS